MFYFCLRVPQTESTLAEEMQEETIIKRISAYELQYMQEHTFKLKISSKKDFMQADNIKEDCLIEPTFDSKTYFKGNSWTIFCDGACKDGYATGLGRQFEHSDDADNRWKISQYKEGEPYGAYIQNDLKTDTFTEGNISKELSLFISTKHWKKDTQMASLTTISKVNKTTGISLITMSASFWDNTYMYLKQYQGFGYKYINTEKSDSALATDFYLERPLGVRNGWIISTYKDGTIKTGEVRDSTASAFELPHFYFDKADAIIKEVAEAKTEVLLAKKQAQEIKKQYIDKICQASLRVNFMNNTEYKYICIQGEKI